MTCTHSSLQSHIQSLVQQACQLLPTSTARHELETEVARQTRHGASIDVIRMTIDDCVSWYTYGPGASTGRPARLRGDVDDDDYDDDSGSEMNDEEMRAFIGAIRAGPNPFSSSSRHGGRSSDARAPPRDGRRGGESSRDDRRGDDSSRDGRRGGDTRGRGRGSGREEAYSDEESEGFDSESDYGGEYGGGAPGGGRSGGGYGGSDSYGGGRSGGRSRH